jgi:glycosyltransferase involved in cell wall biosynthesis
MLKGKNFDLIIANDINTLPLAFALSNGCPVMLDAHEYSPEEFAHPLWRVSVGRLYDWICRIWLPRCDEMSTVCDEISVLFGNNYDKSADFIVINAPPSASHVGTSYRAIPPNCALIRLVHHGLALPERGIELMVQLLDYLDDRFTLDLVLIEHESKYAQTLTCYTKHTNRLRILPAFKHEDIVQSLSIYDMGLFLLPPRNTNQAYALPNKFFEFIQAGLAVAIGPTPPMARIVKKEKLGIVSEDFTPASLARLLNKVTTNALHEYRKQAVRCRHRYCSEAFEQLINDHVRNLCQPRQQS